MNWYDQLNPQQREAVDSLDGPVIVAAGPGTGKTQMLAVRMARIIEQDKAKPEQILALTFTESGAAAMRKRLRSFIGVGAHGVTITTFHGFCNDVIRSHVDEFVHLAGESITEVEQVELLTKLIANTPLTLLKPFGSPDFYVKPVQRAIDELKREGVTPEEFAKLIEDEEKEFQSIDDLYHEKGAHKGKMKAKYQKLEKDISKHKELLRVYSVYQKALRDARTYDYNDMIVEVVRAFETNEALLQEYQEQFLYYLVDEHQDTNRAQNKVLTLLCSHVDSPNLFVVGDDKQAIYRFQGANLDNFLYFKRLYPDARFISLKANYRSRQPILDASTSLIAHNSERLEELTARLESQTQATGEKIFVFELSDPEHEYDFVVEHIKERIETGSSPSEIAVLARGNKDVLPLIPLLHRAGVPFTLETQQNILDAQSVRWVVALMRAVVSYGDDEHLVEVLHMPIFNIDPLDIARVIRGAYEARTSIYDTLEDLPNRIADKKSIEEVGALLKSWALNASNETAETMFTRIVRESGMLERLLRDADDLQALEQISVLYDQVKAIGRRNPRATLKDVVKFIDLLEGHDLMIKTREQDRAAIGVRLMTAHGAKGLEFDHVYIIQAVSGVWSKKRGGSALTLPAGIGTLGKANRNKAQADTKDDDDRRLFYVALTRARHTVTVTYSALNHDGREQLPTQFLDEIDDELKESGSPPPKQKSPFQTRAPSSIPGKAIFASDYKSFVAGILQKQGLTATALNNYLECPWRYFYINLLRIPLAKTKFQRYGTAVHEALSKITHTRRQTAEQLIAFYADALDREHLTQAEYDEMLKKGTDTLNAYFSHYHTVGVKQSQTEMKIIDVEYEGITLSGILDRVDPDLVTGERGARSFVVTDYKTGKRKTRNDILGKTKYSNGNYYRQIQFYALLLELRGCSMSRGVIDFVEPDDQGRFYQESFEIPPEEVAQLKQLIRQTSDDIGNLAFRDYKCEDKCEYCTLAEMLKKSHE